MVDLLPLKEGMRILEIGCGPGVAAKEIARRFSNVYVLCIDRSPKAIGQALKNAEDFLREGKIKFIQTAIEDFELPADEKKFDLAFAIRVGALDGRHPETEQAALQKIAAVLKKNGRLFIDGAERKLQH